MDAPMLQPTRVMLASKNGREQKAISTLLRQSGYEPTCVNPDQAMREARSAPPDVLMLDGELSRMTLDTTLRILGRHPDCRATVIILLGPADGSRVALQRLRMLDAYNVMPRPMTSTAVLAALEEASAWAAELRGMFGIRHRSSHAGSTRHVEGCNSLLLRDVACAFHETPVPTRRYLLRSGKVRADVNLFDIPVYESAVAGAHFVDFTCVETMVCPKCGFASHDPGWFIDLKEANAEDPSPARLIEPAGMQAIQGTAAERMGMLGSPGEFFWSHERTVDQAILAHQLAIHSGLALHGSNPSRMARVAFQLANDYLRLAVLQEHDIAACEEARVHAQGWLTTACDHLEGPTLAKAMYQLLALGLHGNDSREAYEHLKQLDTMHRKSAGSEKPSVERYLHRARKLWSDRDYLQAA